MGLYFITCFDTKHIAWHRVPSFLYDDAKSALPGTPLPSNPSWSIDRWLPSPPSILSTYSMTRSWRQCPVPGTWGWVFATTSAGTSTSGSANRTLIFLKRNVKSKPPKKTGNVISDPCISPASTIWDPILKRTSTRLKLPRDVQPGRSWRITPLQQMSPLLHEFDWQTIEEGWTVACLCPLILRFNGPINLRVMSSEVSLPYLIFLSP